MKHFMHYHLSQERARRFDQSQQEAKSAWRKILLAVSAVAPIGLYCGFKMAREENLSGLQEAAAVIGCTLGAMVLTALGAALLLFLDRFAKRTRKIRPDGSVQTSPLTILLGIGIGVITLIVITVIALVVICHM
jgi:hypothetical protein